MSLSALEIGEFFAREPPKKLEKFDISVNEMNSILTAIKLATKVVNREINKSNTFGLNDLSSVEQKDLAEFAKTSFIDALRNRKVVAGIVSIDDAKIIQVPGCLNCKSVVVLHPMDGSNLVDANISTGTLFSIYARVSSVGSPVTKKDFLQPGKSQLCAGYVIYGCSTMMVCTMGNGTHGFTMDPSLGTFYLSNQSIQIPQGEKSCNIFSVNTGKESRFPSGVKAFIKHARNRTFPCRYIGSMVADFHRNMLKGGIYIYPPTFTDPRPTVSMLFQCFPLAFIAEQAGGKASDGFSRILVIEPTCFDDRVCFIAGSSDLVSLAGEYMARHKIRDDWRSYEKINSVLHLEDSADGVDTHEGSDIEDYDIININN